MVSNATNREAPSLGSSAAAVIDFRHVDKAFGAGRKRTQALRNVNFGVRRATVTGLIGPDGAGKTTLMRLAAGLLAPDAGQVVVLDRNASCESLVVQSSIGYMPQRFGLYEDLTVAENLDLYADLQGVPNEQRADRYRELLDMTGLAPFTRRRAGRLSGGMKQKLGLACTLVHSPAALLLDEPTVGVDPVSRRELWSIVYRLVEQEGMSVLLSTLYLDEAERCHEVVVLHEGEVLGQGPPASFSSSLQGRTFVVSVPAAKKRDIQARLRFAPGVIDAVIQGDRVRLVLRSGLDPDVQRFISERVGASLERVPPRFEDSFIAMLQSRRPRVAVEEWTNGEKEATSAVPAPLTASATASQERVIEARGVERRFGDFVAVNRVTFDVRRGEVFGLLGANGAGKTTTFRMLCGLLPASAGALRVAGVDVRRTAAAARARLGYMSQKFSLYGNLSVRQNLRFFSSAYGLSGRRRTDRLAWALEQFQLGPVADATSADLPLGYKQRLALACALMHEPDILFLDEPTSGVDPLARREFWHRINQLSARGVTVLVTTHFMEEAEYCDRLAIMANGEILALGNPEEVKLLARSTTRPEPTMEEAFIHLIEGAQKGEAA
jgi:ABC-2 type transport system ATP-binding protein